MMNEINNKSQPIDVASLFVDKQNKPKDTMRSISILLYVGSFPAISSFNTVSQSASLREFSLFSQPLQIDGSDGSPSSSGRRQFMASSIGLASLGSLPTLSQAADQEIPENGGVTMYKTGSGLKYIEMEEGNTSGPSPRYGQLAIIKYDAYFKLPNKEKKEKFDSSDSYVIKHGNGRMIPGLDEGLHTMKKGGVRRLIIPPKLGYIDSGLGPLPDNPFARFKLNRLLDEMVAQQGGQLVYDVKLLNFFDDEADQGYYEDANPTDRELNEIFNRLGRNSASGIAGM